MVKDRMESFLRRRRQSCVRASFRENPQPISLKSTSLMSLLDLAKEVQIDLDKLREHVDRLKYLHCELLSSPFHDNRTQEEYQTHQAHVRVLASRIRAGLARLETPTDVQQSPAQRRVHQNQQNALRKEFTTIMADLAAAETNYKNRMKRRVQRQLSIMGCESSEERIDEILDKRQSLFTQDIITDSVVAVQKLRTQLDAAQERNTELECLEQKVTEVTDLFHGVHDLVQAQGETLDRIETHVQRADSFIEGAADDLKKAKKKKRKSRRRRWILLAGAVLVAVLVGAIATLVVLV